jgi:hypothetical protein
MGDALGREQGVAGAETVLLVADPEAKLALKDVKDLVLGAMNVQRWGEAVRDEVFQDGDAILGVRAGCVNGDEGV